MMREQEIERQFGIKIEAIKPNKGVYFLKTNKGNRCLKKINYGVQKLLFVYGAKEHLINKGFTKVDRYCLNVDGSIYASVNEDIYTLSQWIEGRECDFSNIDDLTLAAKAMAELHEASKGYDPPENSKLKTDIGRWPMLMEKRTKALDKMRDMARKKNMKTSFDLSYIKNYEEFKVLGREAKNILDTSIYPELCRIAEEDKSLCHHDYTYHNIIMDKDNKVNIIDFDYCKREIRAYDIAGFITKVCKRVNWDISYAKMIIDGYNDIKPIMPDEYKVIYSFLMFPQRFWRLSNRFYYNEVNWGQKVYDKKIEALIGELDSFRSFLNEFKEYYVVNFEEGTKEV